jgi:hypothetical protein
MRIHADWRCRADLASRSGKLLQARRQQYGNSMTMQATIEPGETFKGNLQQLPPIEGVERIDLVDEGGAIVASIENQPGKQGSLAVYQYLKLCFGLLDAKAAEHGLAIFAEHTADARNRPGAHPNIDRLLAIIADGGALRIEVIAG